MYVCVCVLWVFSVLCNITNVTALIKANISIVHYGFLETLAPWFFCDVSQLVDPFGPR